MLPVSSQTPLREPRLTRRRFLKGSAAIGTAWAVAVSSEATADQASIAQPESALLLPPHLSCPTESNIRISTLTRSQAAEAIIEVRQETLQTWERPQPAIKAGPFEPVHWTVRDLSPATRYEYRLLLKQKADTSFRPAATGSFRTQRKGPATYTALLMTDPHTGSFPPGSRPVVTLDKVVRNATRTQPEFVLELGDNVAWPGSRELPQRNAGGATAAYVQYRRQISPLSMHAPFFTLIGNWEGESGKFPAESIQTVEAIRRALLPNPDHRTYPQGGSAREDYYAFTWGDALFVMLNIQTYSKPSQPGGVTDPMADVNRIEDWTLGEKQMAWFESTLSKATERFRFVCMHHPAGGNAGDRANTLYGRGGGRAAKTGEQAKIHSLMIKHKVQIFFYGHDHVFVDDVVDGIHYALPGSCGAPWKFTRAETGYDRFWPDSGHAQLDITPEKATVTYLNLDNEVLHRFSVAPI